MNSSAKRIRISKKDNNNDQFLDQKQYVDKLLSSLGYDEIDEEIKIKFVELTNSTMKFVNSSFEKDGISYEVLAVPVHKSV
jgi:hypothetical protein